MHLLSGALKRALVFQTDHKLKAVAAAEARRSFTTLLHAEGSSSFNKAHERGGKQIAAALSRCAFSARAGASQPSAERRLIAQAGPGVVQLFRSVVSSALKSGSSKGATMQIAPLQMSFPATARLGNSLVRGSAQPCLTQFSKASAFRSGLGIGQQQRGLATQATSIASLAGPTRRRNLRRLGVLIGASAVGGLVWAVAGNDIEQVERRFKMLYVVPTRLARNIAVVSTIIADYLVSLYNVPEGPAREAIKHECHERCADRLQKLFFKNGGTYIKLGQHVGQLDYLLPEEYVRIMRESMLDKCPVSTYEQISIVIERELGLPPEQAFAEFAPVPLASASLAQVHKARTHDGRQVAVKIQHTHLTDTASADTATVAVFVRAVKWAFPDYDYSWLVAELQESLPRELDFIHEGQNAEQCARNFRTKSPHLASYVKIPEIDWSLTSTKVLTMEFMDGVGVTDVAKQKELGIRTADVAHLVSDVFAAMIFHHGFIHCDPHGGNMLVTTADQNGGSRRLGKARPQLVLLDHGLYRSLDNNLRSNYAALWKALVLGEETGIRRYSTAIAGEDMYILFASVLTMRPWDQVTNQRLDHLVMPDDPEERLKLQGYAAQFMKETTALLARLPRVVLLLLKTNDCLRSVDLALGTPVNSFVTTARECTRALSQIRYEQNPGLASLAQGAVDKVRVEVRVLLMQTLALYEKVRASMVSWGSLFGSNRTRADLLVDEEQLALAIPRGLPA